MPASKSKMIPVLKSGSYGEAYLKDAANTPSGISDASGLSYFEISRRCDWRMEIPAHRLDFYLIFLVTEGEGIHTFGLKEHYIKKNMLCFVGPTMISSWKAEAEEQRGYFCGFTADFFNADSRNRNFLTEFPLFQIDGNSVLHLTRAQMEYHSTLFHLMHTEYENKGRYTHHTLRNLLHALLHKALSHYVPQHPEADLSNNNALRLLRSFRTLYTKDLDALTEGKTVKLRKVSEYAAELGVSPNHLNDTVKEVTGRSAGQLMKSQLIKHATQCLKHSDKTISEIAYLFGYDDPSYFSRYYKAQTGFSPSDFKNTENP